MKKIFAFTLAIVMGAWCPAADANNGGSPKATTLNVGVSATAYLVPGMQGIRVQEEAPGNPVSFMPILRELKVEMDKTPEKDGLTCPIIDDDVMEHIKDALRKQLEKEGYRNHAVVIERWAVRCDNGLVAMSLPKGEFPFRLTIEEGPNGYSYHYKSPTMEVSGGEQWY